MDDFDGNTVLDCRWFDVGFDNDPPSIFEQQIDFIQKSGIVKAMAGLLQAPHGARLYERVLTFLSEYHLPEFRFHPDPQYILALGRSIYQLGIRGIERVYYWRLFIWTLFRRPWLFPLAIMGFHFRQVAELRVG